MKTDVQNEHFSQMIKQHSQLVKYRDKFRLDVEILEVKGWHNFLPFLLGLSLTRLLLL